MINANKVKVSKEVAEAIERQLEIRLGSKEDLLRTKSTGVTFVNKSAPLNDVSFDKLATCLYVGYEVEQTPAEKVAEHYHIRSELFKRFGIGEDFGAMKGIEFVAKTYGLKIEGVNA
ncbi:hypothetical protein [Lysinibacillus xylanilyticus]|uniref:hypothetical protein n=1 Tax=Lysinibacillus xylanilyticus TaxID=582475 RepID=UPI003D0922FA